MRKSEPIDSDHKDEGDRPERGTQSTGREGAGSMRLWFVASIGLMCLMSVAFGYFVVTTRQEAEKTQKANRVLVVEPAVSDEIVEVTDKNAVDFVQQTKRYEGRAIRIKLQAFPIQDSIRSVARCRFTTHSYGPKIDIIVDIPKGVPDLPAARAGDDVVLTFACREGSLREGNEVLSVVQSK